MAPLGGLTSRDLELVVMLARGHTTDRVARELELSRHTVGERISALLSRLRCRNRAELVAYCYAHGLLAAGIWPPSGPADRGVREVRRNARRAASFAAHTSHVDGRFTGRHASRAGSSGVDGNSPLAFNVLAPLPEPGGPVDQLSEAQRAVLAGLNKKEADVLLSVQRRLREVDGDDAEGTA